MVKLIGMLNYFNPVRVLVVGDFMLDRYTKGKVKRISPEAPVSILHVETEENLPGGAGNVALNLVSLGAKVILLGRVGADFAGDSLSTALQEKGVDTSFLFFQKGFCTPVKNRLIAESQQIIRVDTERAEPVSEALEELSIEAIPTLLENVDVVAISDYGKGFLSKRILAFLIEKARSHQKVVVVDPKGDDFSRYRRATIIKPNESEAYAAAQLPRDAPLEDVASHLFKKSDAEILFITRSEAGISLFHKNGAAAHFPVHSKEVKDVTGAGDTVLAVLSLALANKMAIEYAAQLANLAAGIAIERLGCASVHLSELAERLLTLDVENKVFDEEHLFALQQVLQGKLYTVLGVHSQEGMSTTLFRIIRQLAARSKWDKKLILYVWDNHMDEEFIAMLASLKEVDFIVLQCESLRNLCEIIHPHEVFVLEEGQLTCLEHMELLLSKSE